MRLQDRRLGQSLQVVAGAVFLISPRGTAARQMFHGQNVR